MFPFDDVIMNPSNDRHMTALISHHITAKMEAIRIQVAGQGVAFGTRMRTKLVAQNAGKVKDAADLSRPVSRTN